LPWLSRTPTSAALSCCAGRGADDRKDDAFGEDDANELPAARAECRTRGDLALPRRTACEHQVRQIRAADEQHEQRGRLQEEQRLTVPLARQRHTLAGVERLQSIRTIDRHTFGWIGGWQRGVENRRRDGRQVRARAIERPIRFQPSHHDQKPLGARIEPAGRAGRQRFGTKRRRHVESPADLETRELSGCDADNLVAVATEHELLADDAAVAAVLRLPERMAEHDRRVRAPFHVVAVVEHAAERRLDAERAEESAADENPRREARLLAVGADARVARAPREDARECLLMPADLFPDPVGGAGVPHGRVAARALEVFNAQFRQIVRCRDRQRPPGDGLEQLKERRVGADAERKRQQRDGGKRPALIQTAHRKSQVAPRRIDRHAERALRRFEPLGEPGADDVHRAGREPSWRQTSGLVAAVGHERVDERRSDPIAEPFGKGKEQQTADESREHRVLPAFGEETRRARVANLHVEPPRLSGGDTAAEVGQPVVAAALVVEIRIGPLVELFDQVVFEQSADGAIERADPQRFLRAVADLGEDRVAVPVAAGERHEDLEHDGRQRQKRFCGGLSSSAHSLPECIFSKRVSCQ
jgi:hypothetical protein